MPAATCPDREKLAAWSVGRLPDDQFRGIADHLESCDECLSSLDVLSASGDGLLSDLRAPVLSNPYLDEPTCRQAVARFAALDFGRGGGRALAGELVGATLGAYEVFEVLGRGGMGAVYRARHTLLKREVALKVLPAERLSDPRAVARFRREIEVVGRLSHPQIVQASDAGAVDGVHFLVMERVEGHDLARLVKARGPLPVAEACAIIRQASEGLEHARGHGLVHRDVKPSNLMLTPDGRVKVLDLGLARLRERDETSDDGTLTDPGQVLGTADYMAPEQATGSQDVDTRADVYGLGCTLYHLLAGHPPFPAPKYTTTFDKLSAHAREPVPPIRTLRPEVPEGLARVLDRMLAKAPADRFATPADVASALAPFCAEPVPVPIAGPMTSAAGRGRRIVRALVSCAAAALIVLLTVVIIRDNNGRVLWKRDVPKGGSAEIVTDSENQPAPLDLPPSEPVSPLALVGHPAPIKGARSWTIETRQPRGELNTVAFSPDGKLMACAGKDGTIRLLEAASGRLVRALIGHAAQVNSLAFAPVGHDLASASDDTTIRLWDPRSGRTLRSLHLHTKPVRALAWSPDGKVLASGSDDTTVQLWDVESTLPLNTLDHPSEIGFLTWAPGGKQLASATRAYSGDVRDNRARIWDADSGELVRAFEPRPVQFSGLAWSPDGKALAECSDAIRLCDPESGRVIKTFAGIDGGSLAWSPDGKALLCPGGSLDVDSGKLTKTLPGSSFVAWSPDGKRVAGAKFDLEGHQDPYHPISWSPDGGRIVCTSVEGFKVFDSTTGKLLLPVDVEGYLIRGSSPLLWSPDGKKIVATTQLICYFMDSFTGQRLAAIPCPPEYGTFTQVAWAPDGRTLAFVFQDKHVRLWDVAAGRFFATVDGTYEDSDLSFSPDSKTLAINDGRQFMLWDTKGGKALYKGASLHEHHGMHWMPDGKTLIYEEQGFQLWDPETHKTTRTWEGSGGCGGIRFSIDGKTMVASHGIGEVVTWDVASGQRKAIRKIPFPADYFSPDLRVTAAAVRDALRLADVETGQSLGSIVSLSKRRVVSFGPEGHFLGTPGVQRELVYVVQTDEGQETLAPEEFAARFGWKNDPARVRIAP